MLQISANALHWLRIIIVLQSQGVDTRVNTKRLAHRDALTASADLGRLVTRCSFVFDLDVVVLVRQVLLDVLVEIIIIIVSNRLIAALLVQVLAETGEPAGLLVSELVVVIELEARPVFSFEFCKEVLSLGQVCLSLLLVESKLGLDGRHRVE